MALFYVTAKQARSKDFIFTAKNREEAESSVRAYLLNTDDDEIAWEYPEDFDLRLKQLAVAGATGSVSFTAAAGSDSRRCSGRRKTREGWVPSGKGCRSGP